LYAASTWSDYTMNLVIPAFPYPLPNPLPGGEATSSPPPWGEGLGERVGKRQYDGAVTFSPNQ